MPYQWFVRVTRSCFAALAGALAGMLACGAIAADLPAQMPAQIPSDVRINAFVRPAGDRLELLIRVPLAAMTEMEFPTRGPGYLDLARAEEALRGAAQALWPTTSRSMRTTPPLPAPQIARARVSLASDQSFGSYAQARAHLDEPRLPDGFGALLEPALLDVLLVYPIGSDRSQFAVRARVDGFGINVATALGFLSPAGVDRAFELRGDPGLIRLDPSRRQAALAVLRVGLLEPSRGERAPLAPALPGDAVPRAAAASGNGASRSRPGIRSRSWRRSPTSCPTAFGFRR